MRIIRHGELYIPFPIIIRCGCGCEYEAEKEDGSIYTLEGTNSACFKVYCPECGRAFSKRVSKLEKE